MSMLSNIMKIEKKEEFFSSLIALNENLKWSDIMKYTKIFVQQKLREDFSSLFMDSERIVFLESLGFDFEYKDIYGNNFIHYIIKSRASSDYVADKYEKKEQFLFMDKAFDYVAEKINIYEKNNLNEQIISYYVSGSFYNKSIENFNELIEKYPHFDFKAKNSRGQSLLHQAVLAFSNIEIINYLINVHNLDIKEKDNQGNTLLEMFFLQTKNKNNVKLFNTLIENIDISEKRSESSILYYWINNISDKNADIIIWVKHLFERIIENKFYNDTESLNRLFKVLEDKKDIFYNIKDNKLISLYEDAKNSILFMKLNEILPEKDSISKVKINKI